MPIYLTTKYGHRFYEKKNIFLSFCRPVPCPNNLPLRYHVCILIRYHVCVTYTQVKLVLHGNSFQSFKILKSSTWLSLQPASVFNLAQSFTWLSLVPASVFYLAQSSTCLSLLPGSVFYLAQSSTCLSLQPASVFYLAQSSTCLSL